MILNIIIYAMFIYIEILNIIILIADIFLSTNILMIHILRIDW